MKVLSHIRYTLGCVRHEKVLRTAQLEEVLTQGEKSQSTSEGKSHIRYTLGCVRLEKVLRTAQLQEVLTQGEKSQSTSEGIVSYQIYSRLCKTVESSMYCTA